MIMPRERVLSSRFGDGTADGGGILFIRPEETMASQSVELGFFYSLPFIFRDVSRGRRTCGLVACSQNQAHFSCLEVSEDACWMIIS